MISPLSAPRFVRRHLFNPRSMGPLTVVLSLGLSRGLLVVERNSSQWHRRPRYWWQRQPWYGRREQPGHGRSGNPGTGGSGTRVRVAAATRARAAAATRHGRQRQPGHGRQRQPGHGRREQPGHWRRRESRHGRRRRRQWVLREHQHERDQRGCPGYVCNNTWGIKGAWYCYSDGSDTSTSCKGTDGKGAGAVPWNAAATAMCLSGTMGAGTTSKYVGMGFKVNSGPPGSGPAFGTWDASRIVGFAVTLAPGPSMKGSGGGVLNVQFPTPTNMDAKGDSPGVTIPGVGSSPVTYNVLFTDAVLANNDAHPQRR